MSRLIDADHVVGEIEKLKESPWFNYENINGARKIRKEALEIVIALCIKHEPTACDIEKIRAEIADAFNKHGLGNTEICFDVLQIIDRKGEQHE